MNMALIYRYYYEIVHIFYIYLFFSTVHENEASTSKTLSQTAIDSCMPATRNDSSNEAAAVSSQEIIRNTPGSGSEWSDDDLDVSEDEFFVPMDFHDRREEEILNNLNNDILPGKHLFN